MSADHLIIKTQGLTKCFGDFTALDEVTLNIQRGDVFGLLGPNGAGKSTLIRTLMGFLKPTTGDATINGKDCHHQRVQVHQDVTYLPGDAKLYGLMRAKFLIKQFCGLRTNANLERALVIADRLELNLNRWVGLMSTGMRQKLALAICLSVDCPLIILDEPTANLDPTIRGRVLQIVTEAQSLGKTIVFSSHVLSEIEQICNRVGILKRGRLVYENRMDELNQQHRIEFQIQSELPPPPSEIESLITIRSVPRGYLVETPAKIPEVLHWLTQFPISDVSIQPIGLRSVYDQFHH
jgi:ABC-2 type transport system ATP-binding protein